MSPPIVYQYTALLEKGQELIERFASDTWTDYNTHDPGITTLEYLCYALTDLAARVGLPMTTHLAETVNRVPVIGGDFPAAPDILPCSPVTLDDYRRLILDIPGVREVRITVTTGDHAPLFSRKDQERLSFSGKPDEALSLRGFYTADLAFENILSLPERAAALESARRTLTAHRNLCEQFIRVREMPDETITLCTDLELDPEMDVDRAMAEVVHAFDQFISPTPRRCTYAELRAAGLSTAEIFTGPLPRRGFIRDADLARIGTRTVVHSSDVVQLLMDLPGVRAVRRLQFNTFINGAPVETDVTATLPLTEGYVARFDAATSRIRFLKESVPYVPDPVRVAAFMAQVRTRHDPPPPEAAELAPPLPRPEPADLTAYTSIQRHFPRNYGIGPEGLPGTASAARRAAARQFKAFLLLFEQVMADYLAQAAHAPRLLSPEPVERTFAHTLPTDVPGLETLIRDAGTIADYYEDPHRFAARRNRFLDHLLARFAEEYREYSLLAASLYGTAASPLLIRDKERLLSRFPDLSRDRFRAAGVDPGDQTDQAAPIAPEMSGLERKLRVFLGYGTDTDVSTVQEQYFEIYQEADSDSVDEFRFRIRNDKGRILLSSTGHFYSKAALRRHMQQVLRLGVSADHYQIHQAANGRWHYTLHDETGQIMARRISYFMSAENCEKAMNACADFLRAIRPEERLFVLEHILLRPPKPDPQTHQPDPAVHYIPENDHRYLLPTCHGDPEVPCPDGDPYSFRITVVMPAWPERFREMRFRNYLERFIRKQSPAHLFARICWVNPEQMDRFETAFTAWRALLPVCRQPGRMPAYLDALARLIQVWSRLRNIYPAVHLFDCRESDAITPTVLGDSALGDMIGADDDQT